MDEELCPVCQGSGECWDVRAYNADNIQEVLVICYRCQGSGFAPTYLGPRSDEQLDHGIDEAVKAVKKMRRKKK